MTISAFERQLRKERKQNKLTPLMLDALQAVAVPGATLDVHGCIHDHEGQYIKSIGSGTHTALIDRKFIALDRNDMQWRITDAGRLAVSR